MKKKPTLYVIIIFIWILCLGLLITSLYFILNNLDTSNLIKSIFISIILILNSIILGILWFGSIKDLVFSCTHAFYGKKLLKKYDDISKIKIKKDYKPKFLLLYCTRNDFNKNALTESMKQNYDNFQVIILDDSDKEDFLNEINLFSKEYNIEVVRRKNKSGFKAGNLNNYLKGKTDYDYFVVLDSDEILPADYINKVLKYFIYDKNCGAVQARHKATKGNNWFQRLLGLSVGSNGASIQIVKNFYGSNALIGHGMTISKDCYLKTGGFPLVVAEDISFAVDIRNAGFNIIYAPDILCYEEFPINYLSLKKRQCKWTQGNLEYMQKYNKEIGSCKMSWFEKLDLKLSHYSLPIVPILGFFLAVFTIILGFLGYPIIHYSLGIYIIMIIFLCSPLIPDLFVYHKDKNTLLLIPYFILNVITYASLSPMMIKTVFLGIFGKKATFNVTPKDNKKYSLKLAILGSLDSIIFGIIILTLSLLSCRSILPVILIVISCLSAPLIILLSNLEIKEKVKKISNIKEKDNTKFITKDNYQNIHNKNKNIQISQKEFN